MSDAFPFKPQTATFRQAERGLRTALNALRNGQASHLPVPRLRTALGGDVSLLGGCLAVGKRRHMVCENDLSFVERGAFYVGEAFQLIEGAARY